MEKIKRLKVGQEINLGIKGYSVLRVSAGFIVDKLGYLFMVDNGDYKRIEELLRN